MHKYWVSYLLIHLQKHSSNFKPCEFIHTENSNVTTNPREAAMLVLLRRTLRVAVAYCAFQNVRDGRKMRKDAGNKIAASESSYNGKLAHYFKKSCQFVQPL
jgi:hypothetical protein